MIVPWHAVPNSSKLWLRDFPETDVVSLNLIALDGFLLPWICVIAFWTPISFWHCSILWQLVARSDKAGCKEPLFCLFWTGHLTISSDAPSSHGMRVNYNHSPFAIHDFVYFSHIPLTFSFSRQLLLFWNPNTEAIPQPGPYSGSRVTIFELAGLNSTMFSVQARWTYLYQDVAAFSVLFLPY